MIPIVRHGLSVFALGVAVAGLQGEEQGRRRHGGSVVGGLVTTPRESPHVETAYGDAPEQAVLRIEDQTSQAKCFASLLDDAQSITEAIEFCQRYLPASFIHPDHTETATITVTTKSTFILAAATVTESVKLSTITSTIGVTCTSTSTTSLQTHVEYKTRSISADTTPSSQPFSNDALPLIPSILGVSGASDEAKSVVLSTGCLCLLDLDNTQDITTTQTQTIVVTASTTTDITRITPISTTTATVTSCLSDAATSWEIQGLTCGIPSPTVATVGSISCGSPVSPTETSARFRVEGRDYEGTIFEGCVSSGPLPALNLTSINSPYSASLSIRPSPHKCDGTNSSDISSQMSIGGGTLTTQLIAAGRIAGFTTKGTWIERFEDYFIEQIADTKESGMEYWALLSGHQHVSTGGCQHRARGDEESLWAFDGFRKEGFLKVFPEYAVVEAPAISSESEGGIEPEHVELTITRTRGTIRDNWTKPASGAVMGNPIKGAKADAQGKVRLPVPKEPGCYQYKAELEGYMKSSAFYLTVLPAGMGQ